MTGVRNYSNKRATMTVEELDGMYVVHLAEGASLDLMREVFDLYKDEHLFALLPVNSRVNRVARYFGYLVDTTEAGVNIYHIKGD